MSASSKVLKEVGALNVMQESGLVTMAGNGETISVGNSGVLRLDAGGSARTGAILQDGNASGQTLVLLNEGGEKISFNATAATANLAHGGTNIALPTGVAVTLVYNGTLGQWAFTGNNASMTT